LAILKHKLPKCVTYLYICIRMRLINSSELKAKYRNASILSSKRVVFNIKGNDYRLITDIEYSCKIVFIVWFGTHEEYDKINVKTIDYENKNDKDRK